jgi:hypothetical protein
VKQPRVHSLLLSNSIERARRRYGLGNSYLVKWTAIQPHGTMCSDRAAAGRARCARIGRSGHPAMLKLTRYFSFME